MDQNLYTWISLIVRTVLMIYVVRDSAKRKTPYRPGWIVFTFLLWPVFFVYLYYSRKMAQKTLPPIYQREAEMRRRMEENRKRVQAERKAWEQLRREEAAKNHQTSDDLDKAQQQRAEAKAKRMKELEEERRQQEEAAARILKLKK
ncbi:MAG: PLDc-N domain-containing protein [Succiniclasticum sp.]|jgi:flagellar biosynthesis/type III secretory pathway M-ring protein FliF/YscJ